MFRIAVDYVVHLTEAKLSRAPRPGCWCSTCRMHAWL